MALSFSGSGQWLTRGSALLTAYPFSIAAWFKTTSAALNQAIGNLNPSVGNAATLDISNTGIIRAIVGGAVASSTLAVTANTWQLAVATFGSATARAAYLNGGNKGTNATSTALGTINDTCWATKLPTGSIPFSGALAFLMIYNIALGDTDVTNLWNSGLGADPRNIQGASLKGFAELAAAVSPQPDDFTTSWTVTGSPTFVADPFVLTPSAPVIVAPGPYQTRGCATTFDRTGEFQTYKPGAK